jgi:hypothetical protein
MTRRASSGTYWCDQCGARVSRCKTWIPHGWFQISCWSKPIGDAYPRYYGHFCSMKCLREWLDEYEQHLMPSKEEHERTAGT